MKRSATKAQIYNAESVIQHTYKFGEQTMLLAEMLAVKTKCGQQRFVVMHESRGEPKGTLADKLDPLVPVLSLEAQQEALEEKRLREGHGKIHQSTPFAVHSRVKGT